MFLARLPVSRQLILALFAILSSLFVLLLGWPAKSADPTLSIWVEMGPKGGAIARAATPAATCPAIQLGSKRKWMQLHAAPTATFPVRVCERTIPTGTTTASIQGQALPLPKPNPKKILVLGDTGCRIKGALAQACNDPQAWPFQQLANSAAAWQPDLVIHVGDYYYREAACPVGNEGCAGSPWGDNWPTWQAELFTPAAELLRAAPWVVVRGNHELCDRGGKGWFHFLEPRSRPSTCQDYTSPYAIGLGNLNLLMLDSAAAEDSKPKPDQVATYTDQFKHLAKLTTDPTWVLTHRPIWAFGKTLSGKLYRINLTLQAALKNTLPAGVAAVFSGHLHLFESISFLPARPPQQVVGNSGTFLDLSTTLPATDLEIGDAQVQRSAVLGQFGYMTLTAEQKGWSAQVRNPKGEVISNCNLSHLTAICQT